MNRDKHLTHSIVTIDFNERIIYDGSQFQPQYTSEKYGVLGDSVLIFRGGMRLTPQEMVDIKDIIRESHLADVLISADDALHFIIEEFDTQPPNIEIEYYRLYILVGITIELLQKRGIKIEREGTDIFINKSKLNVGIASIGGNSGKVHFGLNISTKGVPDHVNATGLSELGFKEEEYEEFVNLIAKQYIDEINMIKEDITKTRTLR